MTSPFTFRYETRSSASGHPIILLRREMRIWDRRRYSVVYLYPSPDTALAAEKAGGTGFILTMDSAVPHLSFVYVVTCAHLIEGGCWTICLNTLDGKRDIIETGREHWHLHPDGDDVAVASVRIASDLYDASGINDSMLLTEQELEDYHVGIGDDVFIMGRFVHHEGTNRVLPTARFGNIAMMHDEPIRQARGYLQESFLVEMRSINAYSGSPVYVDKPLHSPRFNDRPIDERRKESTVVTTDHEPLTRLLGLDWGHIRVNEPVRDHLGQKMADGLHIPNSSAMTCVVPAWKIRELLDIEPLAMAREQANEKAREDLAPHEGGAEMDSASPFPGSGFTPGLQRTLKDKLDRGEINEVDEDAFLGSMQRAAPPESPPEPDDKAP